MNDVTKETTPIKRRPFGSLIGWTIAVGMSMCYLFMWSGPIAHGAEPVHPFPGDFAWILGGFVSACRIRLLPTEGQTPQVQWKQSDAASWHVRCFFSYSDRGTTPAELCNAESNTALWLAREIPNLNRARLVGIMADDVLVFFVRSP